MFPKQDFGSLYEYDNAGTGKIDLRKLIKNDKKIFLKASSANTNTRDKILITSEKFQYGFLEVGDALLLDLLLTHCDYQVFYLDKDDKIQQIAALTKMQARVKLTYAS